MHLSSRTDIEAPIDFVYSVLADFEGWERAGMRRGAEISRTDKAKTFGPGMAWDVGFRFRGKDRKIAIKLTALEPQQRLAFRGVGRLVEGEMSLDLLSLSPKRTRVTMHLDIRPLTLGARLFLQSMKIAKARVQQRLNKRMEGFAREIESRQTTVR